MGLKEELRRLKREAGEDAVIIRGLDGSLKAFGRTHVLGELYLARLDRAVGREPRESEFMQALASATPESRAAVEALDGGGHYADLDENDPDADPPEDLSE